MRHRWFGWLIVGLLWAGTLAVYAWLPESLPTHWNFQGEPDDWSPRIVGAFIVPVTAASLLVLLPLLRGADPRRAHVERFGEYDLFLNLVVLFLALMHTLTLAEALGAGLDVPGFTVGALGLLLLGMGNYLPRLRSNWWMGVRTPWTLSSERVWQRTHRFSGRLMVACGVALLVAAFLPAVRGWTVLPVLGVLAAAPALYSYLTWRRETRDA